MEDKHVINTEKLLLFGQISSKILQSVVFFCLQLGCKPEDKTDKVLLLLLLLLLLCLSLCNVEVRGGCQQVEVTEHLQAGAAVCVLVML